MIRLPEEKNPLKFEYRGRTYPVQTIMLAKIMVRQYNCPGVGMYIDIGEKVGTQPIRTFQNMVCNGDRSLEEEITTMPVHWHANIGVQMTREVLLNCVRLCCTLCLLENDPEVITATSVLNKDKAKFEHSPRSEIYRQGPPKWKGGMGYWEEDDGISPLSHSALVFVLDRRGANGSGHQNSCWYGCASKEN